MRKGMMTISAGALVALMLSGLSAEAVGQEAGMQFQKMALSLDSGFVENTTRDAAVVYSKRVVVPGASWLRVHFDRAELAGTVGSGQESYLLITSELDGAYQYLNAEHLRQWRYTSAYFNGDAVTVELVAYPGTGRNRVSISQAITGQTLGGGERSICGDDDDRVLSYDDRQGRLLPGGCTAWMIDDCNHCFLTAGHCTDSNDTVEFNVPLSDSDGSLNHPGPEDQYAIDMDSLQTNGGLGQGDDWGYFGCYPNSNTGLYPVEVQGAWYTLAMPPSVTDQSIRITGYGVVYSPIPYEWEQVQKTHVGPYAVFDDTLVGYTTDTTGGNSGSPVVLEETGEAIGIHTHGGCGYDGYNVGTGANHSGLQNALANPTGSCIPMIGIRVTPGNGLTATGDPGGPFTPASVDFEIENLEEYEIEYEVTGMQSWVTITGGAGVLSASGTATVTVAINSLADSFPIGAYSDVISFVNLTTHEGDTERTVSLRVGEPSKVLEWTMDTNPGWTTEGLWAWGEPTGGGGDYGDPDPTSGYTGDNVYGYNLSGDYENQLEETHLTTRAIDCSNLGALSLRFWRWLGVEQPSYDHAYLRISNDGVNWTTLWENEQEISDGAWVAQEFDIATYADGQPTVYLRWTIGPTDYSWQYCGWNIDDVELWGLESPDQVPGDMNCDAFVNFDDIDPFVLALVDQAQYEADYPDCEYMNADLDGNGVVNFDDIDGFIEALVGDA